MEAEMPASSGSEAVDGAPAAGAAAPAPAPAPDSAQDEDHSHIGTFKRNSVSRGLGTCVEEATRENRRGYMQDVPLAQLLACAPAALFLEHARADRRVHSGGMGARSV